MDASPPLTHAREPGFSDYLKAAFNVRVHVPGLGGVPMNWLYLAIMAGASVAAWPVALVGVAGEVALMTSLSTSGRFQQAVRARLLATHGGNLAQAMAAAASQLAPDSRERYEVFARNCEDVIQIARRLGQGGDDLETYSTHLTELRDVYCKMLMFAETLAAYSRDWDKTDPRPEIATVEKEIAAGKLSEQLLASRQATLEVLKKRVESRDAVAKRADLLHSEMERLEQQLALLRDQALLTRDPSVFSQSMDTAAGLLEEHNKWLQDNAVFLQALDQMTEKA